MQEEARCAGEKAAVWAHAGRVCRPSEARRFGGWHGVQARRQRALSQGFRVSVLHGPQLSHVSHQNLARPQRQGGIGRQRPRALHPAGYADAVRDRVREPPGGHGSGADRDRDRPARHRSTRPRQLRTRSHSGGRRRNHAAAWAGDVLGRRRPSSGARGRAPRGCRARQGDGHRHVALHVPRPRDDAGAHGPRRGVSPAQPESTRAGRRSAIAPASSSTPTHRSTRPSGSTPSTRPRRRARWTASTRPTATPPT